MSYPLNSIVPDDDECHGRIGRSRWLPNYKFFSDKIHAVMTIRKKRSKPVGDNLLEFSVWKSFSGSSKRKSLVQVEPESKKTFSEKEQETELEYYDAVVNSQNLMAAIKKGDLNAFKNLVDGGADVNAQGMWSNTPLIVACQYGKDAIALEILKMSWVDVNHVNEKGGTAILFACLEGFSEIVQKLILLEANIHIPVATIYNSMTDQTVPCTPFSIAISNGHLECVQALISAGSYVNERFPLSFINGNLVMTDNSVGVTPLMIACICGHIEVMSYLLSCGAQVDCTVRDGQEATILHHICRAKQNSLDMLQILESHGGISTSLLTSVDKAGDTALHMACEAKNLRLVEYLLLTCSVHVSNTAGVTPLHIAVKRRMIPLISLLLQHGANPLSQDRKGVSSVDMAMKYGRESSIMKLLRGHLEEQREAKETLQLQSHPPTEDDIETHTETEKSALTQTIQQSSSNVPHFPVSSVIEVDLSLPRDSSTATPHEGCETEKAMIQADYSQNK
mmetsp:Transcript_11800/g.11866  ORF Transcript_11800/g.11866 Transcript_11800/m.11866 type:complete len:507 (+) Transcript_11800:47-1567(+)